MVAQKQGQLLRFVGIVLCLISAGLMFFGAGFFPIRIVLLIVGIVLIASAAKLRKRAKKSYKGKNSE